MEGSRLPKLTSGIESLERWRKLEFPRTLKKGLHRENAMYLIIYSKSYGILGLC